MISTIIPIRDREISRLKRCIKYLKKANKSCGNPIREIIVVDYGSKSPLKQDKGYKVIRIESDCWNKAHAINLGILSSKEPYILTIDVDMLIDEKHLREITKNLSEENFIIDTNVRRLDKGYLHLPYYEEMVSVSNPWFSQSRNQLFNLANGGFQVYPRTFYDKIGGIMEGMGKFHRAVDNWVFYMARMNNMNTVDISYPLLHLEHKKQKEDHYDKEIREQAEAYAIYKAWYLGKMIENNESKNTDSFYGKDKPCEDLFNKFLEEVSNRDNKIQEAINNNAEQVTIAGQTFKINWAKKSIIICVINNSGVMPDYFVWSLWKLYLQTIRDYDVEITHINACSIEHMRNLAVKYALGQNPQKKKYDYLVQLDDDHIYNENFINKFIPLMEENKWPILTGLTAGKKPPYKNTQYKKWETPMDTEGNPVPPTKKNEIIEVAASGPVGMIMDTRIFNNIPFPWYKMEYGKIEIDGEIQDKVLGSDLYFCKLLGKHKIPIRVDLATSFPHIKEFCLNRGKILPKP